MTKRERGEQVRLHDLPVESRSLLQTEEAGNIEALVIDDIKIDATYQRDLSADLVQQMAREWDITIAGPIVVSRRGRSGDLYVVDGQHRMAAAKLAGETHILAQVVSGLGRKTEAEMRLKGNVRRGDKAIERFRAQIAAGNPESVAIVSLCESFETKVNLNGPVQDHGINAISALERLYRRDKGVLLTRVFEIIQRAWGEVGGMNATNPVMQGIAWALSVHSDEIDRARLVERLQGEGAESLLRKARAHQAAMGGSLWLNWYRALVEVYNLKLPEGARLEWRTRGYTLGETASRGGHY
jgi:hypothetical protein